ncbi:methyltransferase domain-containing protein [Beijerinckia mobilis]|uniref:methyltransferase domain-containing protein n=1 Tax=Beijerinckia mobilis TaxID=231434 RepID=UPI00054D218D|nr:class I SAM-dependent methyltransferase [Beijerinckia mobilis]
MSNAYDAMDYPYAVRSSTHPALLGALSQLVGRPPAPFRDCRVLEIGAGDGVNLASMATTAPDSEFVGIDLSEHAIARGRVLIAEAGLANVRLDYVDIRAFEAPEQSFDYIIAHGVYAWVPEEVRDAILKLCGRYLSPRGVAMVSYNALPGCRLRQAMRDMLIYSSAGFSFPEQKLAAARHAAAFHAEHWAKNEAFSAALAAEARDLLERPDGLLFHDELGEFYEPQLFSQVAAAARAHGLDYLCDADLSLAAGALWEDEFWTQSLPLTGGDFLAYEQFRDFVETRFFRRSLFCRAGAPLDRRFLPERARGLFLDARLEPFADTTVQAGEFAFKTARGGEISTRDPAFAAALQRLGEAFPAALPFEALATDAVVTDALMRLFVMGMARLTTEPPPVGRDYGEKPFASPLARAQARLGAHAVATYRHTNVGISGEEARRFLQLLDGTRTVAEMVQEMAGSTGRPDEASASVVEGLKKFAAWGLTRG